MRIPRPRLPKFSLTEVLLVTTAAAGALAVSGGADSSTGLHVEQMLLFFGLFLCSVQLALHAIDLSRRGTLSSSFSAHLRLAALTRWGVVLASVSVAVITLLSNRKLVETEWSRDGSYTLCVDLWCAVIPYALAIGAIALLQVPHKQVHRGWPVVRWCTTLTVVALLIVYGLIILWDRSTISFLVHVATNHVEVAQRGHWHRPGVFPNHLTEGYASFWKTTAVATLWLMAVLLLMTSPVREAGWHRWVRTAFLVMVVIVVALFDLWYYHYEFPRISPDMATECFYLLPWGFAGYGLLCLGLAHYGGMLVTRGPALGPVGIQTVTLRRSPLVILAALSLGAGILVALRKIISDLSTWLPGGLSLTSILEHFHLYFLSMLLAPETLLFLLILPGSAKLLWQSIRSSEVELPLKPFALNDYMWQFSLALALLLVGIPCLRALGFAMWIGPQWPFF